MVPRTRSDPATGTSPRGPAGLASFGIYAAAGAGAGATNAALYGGDIGKAAGYGAVSGGVGYELGTLGQLSIFGNSTALAGTANYITTAAIRNSIMSGAAASYEGRDIGQAMVEGSMEGAFASATNTLTGHVVGVLLAEMVYRFSGSASILICMVTGWGAITFGNVIIGDAGFLAGRAENGGGYLNLDHEMSHVQQGMTLSVGYVYLPNARNFWEF